MVLIISGQRIKQIKLSYEAVEQLVYEVISFLQKWGLWTDVTIIANNTAWRHTYNDSIRFRDLVGVEIITPANPEDFDMVYGNPLYNLLNYGEYAVLKCDVNDEAWEIIFKQTCILDDYIDENFAIYDIEELRDQLLMDKYDSNDWFEWPVDEKDDCYIAIWNTTDFDTWDEYQDFLKEDGRGIYLEYELPNSNNEFQEFVDRIVDIECARHAWDEIADIAKKHYIKNELEGTLYCNQLASYIITEFEKIFDKYDLC